MLSLLNLVNAIGTGCDGGMKSKAPQLSIPAGLGDAGQFSTAASHTPRQEWYVGGHCGGKGKPWRRAHSKRQGPGGSGGDPRICPHCAEQRYAQEIGKKNPGQEWADRGVSLSARAAISVALATILHAELRAQVNRRSARRFVLVLKVG